MTASLSLPLCRGIEALRTRTRILGLGTGGNHPRSDIGPHLLRTAQDDQVIRSTVPAHRESLYTVGSFPHSQIRRQHYGGWLATEPTRNDHAPGITLDLFPICAVDR